MRRCTTRKCTVMLDCR